MPQAQSGPIIDRQRPNAFRMPATGLCDRSEPAPQVEVETSKDAHGDVVAAYVNFEATHFFGSRVEQQPEGCVRRFRIKSAKTASGKQIARLVSEPEVSDKKKAEIGSTGPPDIGTSRTAEVGHEKTGLSIQTCPPAARDVEALEAWILGLPFQEPNINGACREQQAIRRQNRGESCRYGDAGLGVDIEETKSRREVEFGTRGGWRTLAWLLSSDPNRQHRCKAEKKAYTTNILQAFGQIWIFGTVQRASSPSHLRTF